MLGMGRRERGKEEREEEGRTEGEREGKNDRPGQCLEPD